MDVALRMFPQVLVDGLIQGFMYALIALGYTMVYGVLQLINFAHSEIFVFGAFVGVELLLLLQAAGYLTEIHAFILLLLVLAAGMLGAGVLAVGIERVAYRPLRYAPRLIPLISAIGVSFFLQDAIRLVESIWRNAFFLTYPTPALLNERFFLGEVFDISLKSIIVIVAAVGMLLGLNALVNRTKLGKAIRAVAEDKPTAALMGINVDRMISMTFLIGGAMGGAAGVLFGFQYTLINPYTGFVPGIKAFTAAVLGGIGSLPGAMLGGLLIGLIETLWSGYFTVEYKDVAAFSILILVLIFRPTGLLGKPDIEKV